MIPLTTFEGPDVCLANDGLPILAYNAVLGGVCDGVSHVWVSKYTAENAVSTPVRVDSEILVDNKGMPTITKLGSILYIVYFNPTTTRYVVRRSSDNGFSWSSPSTPSPLASYVADPSFATGSVGTVCIINDGSLLYLFVIPSGPANSDPPGNMKFITSSDGITWSALTDANIDATKWWRVSRAFRVHRSPGGNWIVSRHLLGDIFLHAGVRAQWAAAPTGPWGTEFEIDYNTANEPRGQQVGSLVANPSGGLSYVYFAAKSDKATDGNNDSQDNVGHKNFTGAGELSTSMTTGQEAPYPDGDKTVIELVNVVAITVPTWNKVYAWGIGNSPASPTWSANYYVLTASHISRAQIYVASGIPASGFVIDTLSDQMVTPNSCFGGCCPGVSDEIYRTPLVAVPEPQEFGQEVQTKAAMGAATNLVPSKGSNTNRAPLSGSTTNRAPSKGSVIGSAPRQGSARDNH